MAGGNKFLGYAALGTMNLMLAAGSALTLSLTEEGEDSSIPLATLLSSLGGALLSAIGATRELLKGNAKTQLIDGLLASSLVKESLKIKLREMQAAPAHNTPEAPLASFFTPYNFEEDAATIAAQGRKSSVYVSTALDRHTGLALFTPPTFDNDDDNHLIIPAYDEEQAQQGSSSSSGRLRQQPKNTASTLTAPLLPRDANDNASNNNYCIGILRSKIGSVFSGQSQAAAASTPNDRTTVHITDLAL